MLEANMYCARALLGALILGYTVINTSANVFAIGLPQHRRTCFIGSKFVDTRPRGGHISIRSDVCRSTTFHCMQDESRIIDETSNSANNAFMEPEKEKEFFVSDAQFVHLGPAARILTEEFYSARTNFITFQIEKLKTVLSLESTFPNRQNSLRNEYSRRPLQQMFVACNAKTGVVIGFAEVDARPLSNSGGATYATTSSTDVKTNNNILRSYMYNLAVDKAWKRKGVASALVRACEQFVLDMHDSCIEKRLYLRVRKCNDAAIGLYQSLGYKEMDPETLQLSKEDINSGSLEEGELILFARDLPLDAECELD